MATVASRRIRSTPFRDASQTWKEIISLLTRGKNQPAAAELELVAGVAASIIADLTPQDSPIVVSCEGPRTRIYCTYGDNAIDGSDAQEEVLGFDPLKGEWAISLPCEPEDLSWIQIALGKKSKRITARNRSSDAFEETAKTTSETTLQVDLEGFLNK